MCSPYLILFLQNIRHALWYALLLTICVCIFCRDVFMINNSHIIYFFLIKFTCIYIILYQFKGCGSSFKSRMVDNVHDLWPYWSGSLWSFVVMVINDRYVNMLSNHINIYIKMWYMFAVWNIYHLKNGVVLLNFVNIVWVKSKDVVYI